MTKKETKDTWTIITIIVVGLIILFAVIAPLMRDKSEKDRLDLEMSKCEYSRESSVWGSNGKCVIQTDKDGVRHVYWEREW